MYETKALDLAVQDLRNILRDGLVATDIWDRTDGLSLAGHNQQPVAVALFTRITAELESSLADSNFPPLARYYLLDMGGNHLSQDVAVALHTPFETAEALKVRYGHVLPDRVAADETVWATVFGERNERSFSRRFVCEVLEARADARVDAPGGGFLLVVGAHSRQEQQARDRAIRQLDEAAGPHQRHAAREAHRA